MKPVYETERRSNNRWLLAVIWAFGIFCVLSFTGMVIAQVAVRATAPTATTPQPPLALSPDGAAVVVAAPAQPVVKWEYKSTYTSTEEMKKAGAEGWELVAVSPVNNGNATRAFYKRPLRDGAGAAAVDPKREGERPDNSQSDSQGPPAGLRPERQ